MTRDVSARAEELLTSEPLMAHLATSHDDRPHVAPIWYVYREGTVEVAITGRKLANVRRNPRVALSVQKDEDGRPKWGSTVLGTGSVIEDDDEARAALQRINRRYGADEDAWSGNTAVRIDVGSVEYWEY